MPASRPISRRVLASSALVIVGAGYVVLQERPQAAKPARAAVQGPAALVAPAPATAATSTATAVATPRVDRAALTAELDAYRSKRGGTMGLFVRDLRSDQGFAWRPFTNESLSTIKVLILVACLRNCQDTGVRLTETQHNHARRMIQSSNNASTEALLAWVDVSNVQRTAESLSMKDTVVRGGSAGGWWGYSTTTPADLVTMLGAIARGVPGTAVIHAGHRAYIRDLMAGVVAEQRWGVADPPLPSNTHTETKNGWGPLPDGYRLNSIGNVIGNGRDYSMAILTRSPQGFRYGKATINGLSEIVYEALSDQL